MATDPWTDSDPQPSDFDAELALLDASAIEHHDGDPSARLRVLVSVEGEDATRLDVVEKPVTGSERGRLLDAYDKAEAGVGHVVGTNLPVSEPAEGDAA